RGRVRPGSERLRDDFARARQPHLDPDCQTTVGTRPHDGDEEVLRGVRELVVGGSYPLVDLEPYRAGRSPMTPAAHNLIGDLSPPNGLPRRGLQRDGVHHGQRLIPGFRWLRGDEDVTDIPGLARCDLCDYR